MRRTLALAVLLLALPATAAHAALAPPPVTRVTDVPYTDGRSIAAWETGGAIRVLGDDQPFGAEALVLPPDPRCRFGGVNATDLAFDCPDGALRRVILRDRATGAARPTAVSFAPAGANGQDYALTAIGDGLAVIHTGGSYHVDAYDELHRLSDGAVLNGVGLSPRRILSLDAPRGRVALCAPLSVGRHRAIWNDDEDGSEHPYMAYDPVAYRAPWLVTIHGGRLLLKRCGVARTVRDLGAASLDTVLRITSRYVAWTPWAGGRVRVHRFADHATFRWVLPGTYNRNYGIAFAATDRRLWVGDREGNAYIIEP